MPTFRELAALSICGLLIVALTFQIVRALRTGTLRHSDASSKLVRAKQPVRYWLLLAVFVAMDAWLCGVVVLIVRRMGAV